MAKIEEYGLLKTPSVVMDSEGTCIGKIQTWAKLWCPLLE